MSVKLGNPAPLGLLAFGMTTAFLMFVEMGWAEEGFLAVFFGYAFFYGGFCQVLVAIFEVIKGSSFSFAVFGSYGAFWLAWGLSFQERNRTESALFEAEVNEGEAASFILWGLLTSCFFIIALRKNICLILTLGWLAMTFFVLAAMKATGNVSVRKAAGSFGFITALCALYTGVAELINEEYGRHVLPGLTPIHAPERFKITKDSITQLISYHAKSNTLLLQFRGIHIKTHDDVQAIQDAVIGFITDVKAPDNKVHVIVDYEDVHIAESIAKEFWAAAGETERNYYLSVRRFHVSSFGSKAGGNASLKARPSATISDASA